MKISSLYNVIFDASDMLDCFEGVDSQDRLVSRLERLKHSNTEDLMACIDGLRDSISEILDDSLEVSTILGEIEGEDDMGVDDELNNLTEEKIPPAPAITPESATTEEPAPLTEKQNPAVAAPPKDKKPDPS